MQFFSSSTPTTASFPVPPYRRQGESFVDCFNRCSAERGVESGINNAVLVGCGFGALLTGLPAGPVLELPLLPVLLGSCIALTSGVSVGIAAECVGRCANIPSELTPVDITIEFDRAAATPTAGFVPAVVGSNWEQRPQTFRHEPACNR